MGEIKDNGDGSFTLPWKNHGKNISFVPQKISGIVENSDVNHKHISSYIGYDTQSVSVSNSSGGTGYGTVTVPVLRSYTYETSAFHLRTPSNGLMAFNFHNAKLVHMEDGDKITIVYDRDKETGKTEVRYVFNHTIGKSQPVGKAYGNWGVVVQHKESYSNIGALIGFVASFLIITGIVASAINHFGAFFSIVMLIEIIIIVWLISYFRKLKRSDKEAYRRAAMLSTFFKEYITKNQ